MSCRNRASPKLVFKPNLSPRPVNLNSGAPGRSATVSPTSPPSSCVSSEHSHEETGDNLGFSNSPEVTSMILVGCPRCLMYVIVSEDGPKCPKCKSTVLLDILKTNPKSFETRRC